MESCRYSSAILDNFILSRPSAGPPTDLDLFLLDLLLVPVQTVTQTEDSRFPQIHSSLTNGEDTHTPPELRAGPNSNKAATSTMCDNVLPDMLLKCPKHAFDAFTRTYNISPTLHEAISAARRRHANRIHKRLSRSRLRSTSSPDSQTKPRCVIEGSYHTSSTVFDASVAYQELQAALNIITSDRKAKDSPGL